MLQGAKIAKDIRELSDLVLMGEIATREKIINQLTGELQMLGAERDRRLAAAAKPVMTANGDTETKSPAATTLPE